MRCPICRCNLVLKHGKRGDFYGCTNPHCRHTQCVERPIGQKLQSTQVWFRELLSSFKGDPLFEAEGLILELEEQVAKRKKDIESLVYVSVGHGIISRDMACHYLGINRADLDDWIEKREG